MAQATDLEQAMQALINQERTSRGLDPLSLELRLNDSADAHTDWMLAVDQFSHTGAGGSSAGDRMEDAGFQFSGNWTWGENIAWQSERGAPGLMDDMADLHRGLMNSPGHRANILNPSFDYMGIGINLGDYRGYEAVMVTQNFARTGAPVQIDTGGDITNRAPEVSAADVTLVNAQGLRRSKLEDHVTVTDPDGDTIQLIEVRDTDGRSNLVVKGQGRVDARDGYVFDADDLDAMRLARSFKPGESELEIRASDGTDWGDWETFSLTTLTADQVA